MRKFRFLDSLTVGFVAVLLISNLVGPKISQIPWAPLSWLRISAAEFFFPLTYICGDVFTEVYGYGASRRAIWLGFFSMAALSLLGALAVWLPPAPEWGDQQAFAKVFAVVPRFAMASLIAYWCGEFTNSYTLAKLKLLTRGKWLWTRTIGSTITGQAVDTAIIIIIAFVGAQSWPMLGRMIVSSYLIKVSVEVLATPFTYAVVRALKRAEGVDTFDRKTNFNPFAVAES
jgi:queuosine precursor transporter